MIEVISIHIPKTAGRSFLAMLHSAYSSDHVAHYETNFYPDKSAPEIEQFKSKLNNNIKIIHGHFQFQEIKDLQRTNKSKVITWLRDPVERVISNYGFFIKRAHQSPDDPELIRRKNESLLEYASLENSRNRMSKFIDGCDVNDFYFIGLTEYFGNDISILAGMLNWKPIDIPRINDNAEFKSQLPKVTNEERKIIRDLNSNDIELYNRVLEMHKKRID